MLEVPRAEASSSVNDFLERLAVCAGILSKGSAAMGCWAFRDDGSNGKVTDAAAGMLFFIRSDYAEAYAVLRPLADSGNPDAQFFLGEMFRYGLHVQQHIGQAITLYRHAATQKHGAACYALAQLARHGTPEMPRDETKAFEYMKMAGEYGDRQAPLQLALMYYGGIGTEKNYREALRWARRPGLIHPFPWWNLNSVPRKDLHHQLCRNWLLAKLSLSRVAWWLRSLFGR